MAQEALVVATIRALASMHRRCGQPHNTLAALRSWRSRLPAASRGQKAMSATRVMKVGAANGTAILLAGMALT